MGLAELVPAELKSGLGRIIPQGYRMAKLVVEGNDFLSWDVGRQALPYIRWPAIDFCALRMAMGLAGVEAKIGKNSIGNHSFIELRTKSLAITFSHQAKVLGELQTLPRPAKFRSKMGRFNPQQLKLWEEDPARFFGDSRISAILFHAGNDAPLEASLMICDFRHKKILDELPIPLIDDGAAEIEEVTEFIPQLKKFLKEGGASDA